MYWSKKEISFNVLSRIFNISVVVPTKIEKTREQLYLVDQQYFEE